MPGHLTVLEQSWGAAGESLIYSTPVISPEPASARDGMAEHLLASVIRHGPLVVS